MWLGWHLDKKDVGRSRKVNYKLIGTICSGTIVYLSMALRNNQASDYIHMYVYKWNMYRVGAFATIGSEPMIDSILYLLGKITANPQWIMAVLSLLVVVPLWISIYRISDLPFVSVALFFLARHYFAAMVAFDFEIAMSFVALACVFIEKNNFALYSLFVIIGGLSYYPVLLFLPLYFLRKKRVDNLLWILFTAVISVLIRIVKIATEADDLTTYIVTSLPMYSSWFLFEALFIAGLVIVISAQIPDIKMKQLGVYELNVNLICIALILNVSLFGIPETWVMVWSYINIFLIPKLLSAIDSTRTKALVIVCLATVLLYVGYNKIWLGNVFNPMPYVFFLGQA